MSRNLEVLVEDQSHDAKIDERPEEAVQRPAGEVLEEVNGATRPSRPKVCIQSRTRDTAAALAQHLRATNDIEPRLFWRALGPCRASIVDGLPLLEALTEDILQHEADELVDFVKIKKDEEVPDNCPRRVATHLLTARPEDSFLPVLTEIVGHPVYGPDFKPIASPGYYPEEGILYIEPDGVRIPPVSENPSPAEVQEATRHLLDEVLGDFPFRDAASRAHAVCFALERPLIRALNCITPVWQVVAPTPGTGKTLCLNGLAITWTGREATSLTAPSRNDDGEWKKEMAAAVMAGRASIFVFDNVNGNVDCGGLASQITLEGINIRALGTNHTVSQPNTASYGLTANNPTISEELSRRSYSSVLDAATDAPEERTGFRHMPYLPWIRANRGKTMWSILTMIQSRIAAGRPVPKEHPVLGSFEAWCSTMAGILAHVGIEGFLQNRDATRSQSGSTTNAWREAFAAIRDEIGLDREFTAKDLFDIVERESLLLGVVHGEDPRGRRRSLGRALSSRLGVVATLPDGGQSPKLVLESAGTHRKGAALYRLTVPKERQVLTAGHSAGHSAGSNPSAAGDSADLPQKPNETSALQAEEREREDITHVEEGGGLPSGFYGSGERAPQNQGIGVPNEVPNEVPNGTPPPGYGTAPDLLRYLASTVSFRQACLIVGPPGR